MRKSESNYNLLLSNLLKYLQSLSGGSSKMIPHSQTSFSHHFIAYCVSTSVCSVFISIKWAGHLHLFIYFFYQHPPPPSVEAPVSIRGGWEPKLIVILQTEALLVQCSSPPWELKRPLIFILFWLLASTGTQTALFSNQTQSCVVLLLTGRFLSEFWESSYALKSRITCV